MSRIYGKILTVVGGSSNGRTADSGSVSRGSNPLPPAKERRVFEVEGPQLFWCWKKTLCIFLHLCKSMSTSIEGFSDSFMDQHQKSI